MFWIYTATLSILAILFVLVPVWRRTRLPDEQSEELRRSANIALFQERSDELESELSVGNIDQQQFDSLLLEQQQNLLADVNINDSESTASGKINSELAVQSGLNDQKINYVLPVMMVLLIPLLSYPLYQQWGFIDDVEVMPLFQETVDGGSDPEEARRLVVAIGEYAQDHPEMPWPFYFLAENFASMGMFEEAQISYQRAASLLEPNAEKALVLARVATAMYINSDLQLTDEVQAVIDEARELNPNEMSILQLLAADAENNGDWQTAIANWRLLIQGNPNSEMAQQLRMRINVAQSLLSAEQGESAGPVVEVSVSLAEGLELDGNLRVFVAARNASREGMPPLAAIDTVVSALPVTVRLDNNSAVGPFNLSSAEEVYVSALVSLAGVATPASGDYRIQSSAFPIGEEISTVELVISEPIP